MPEMLRLKDSDWDTLLDRIKDGRCTPIIGADVGVEIFRFGSDFAKKWAQEKSCPVHDTCNLSQVAQYLAMERDPMVPKEQIIERLQRSTPPNFDDPFEPHILLADLHLPIYITTNYDDFMFQALQKKHKDPVRVICKWNDFLKHHETIFETNLDFNPSPANPVIYHLHGHAEMPESLVLTEDDYLDFIKNISTDRDLIPHQIQKALAGRSLLFIGYGLTDWSFRVLLRGLVTTYYTSQRRKSVAVIQMPWIPMNPTDDAKSKLIKTLENYFRDIRISIHLGNTGEFIRELGSRWRNRL